jgi:hypothetical protein
MHFVIVWMDSPVHYVIKAPGLSYALNNVSTVIVLMVEHLNTVHVTTDTKASYAMIKSSMLPMSMMVNQWSLWSARSNAITEHAWT